MKQKSLPKKNQAENPLILRCHRLMEAFAKSDDERDFYLDRHEGFLIYADLDKGDEELVKLEKELDSNPDRYVAIPKMTFYETKKIMEGFVNEKVYDIDTKEKLLEIIQSKEARENFLDFIYDHHSELEKWQQYYQERSRIRIIEWLRQNHFEFVFEEDLDLPKDVMEKVKIELFNPKPSKDVVSARKAILAKAKSYYSTEALNPRPKRGRPPKLIAKPELEPQMTQDVYTTVPNSVRPFLFIPEYSHGSFIIFSQKFENEAEMVARRRQQSHPDFGVNIESLNLKLSQIRNLSNRWIEEEEALKQKSPEMKLFNGNEIKPLAKNSSPVKKEKEIGKQKSLSSKNKVSNKQKIHNKEIIMAKAAPKKAASKAKPAAKKAAPAKKKK